MKNISLNIPDMQSAHCQMRVKNAIQDIDGISIDKVEPGTVSFTVANEQSQVLAIHAIEQAGYTVNPSDNQDTANDAPACCTTK
ncbi:heavy-metal-associated domain-containing protein [Flavobacterium sp. NKUCC04_CG]|uniref:heavy-metal-associated domain-containing protein n=1 Tax=Flavobacterium sp. NKUCC04_CG TaxID=2842121 RepID=UPI001C5AF4F7|nr:heavy-metal-associated domain-containing protein [Flavobacterium sp. NKUCC04_CG]MBW3519251.1 heavy-metal-associated domain-containing protein [Flavobacterium sp. NKUCC04_CG]